MAVALMLTSATLTACSDDDPDSPVSEKEIKTANVAVSLCVNQAMADTYDITGTTTTGEVIPLSTTPVEVNFRGENVSMYYITSQVTGTQLPIKSIVKLKFMLKDGYTVPEKSDFALSVVASGDVTYTDGSSGALKAERYELESKGVKGSMIDAYTDKLNYMFGSMKAILDKDGFSTGIGD